MNDKMAEQLQILLFGQLAQLAGTDRVMISGVKDTQSLRKDINALYPALQHIEYAIAVEKKIVNENTAIDIGNTIALLPPFSGG